MVSLRSAQSSVFSHKDIAALRSYRYKSVDKSFVANYILNPFWWSTIINFVPLYIAPNLITLSGFTVVIANILLLLYYSFDLVTACPSWAYVSFAVGLFIYQSLDAIDGKQARRTGTSSPLGELFDHGCDALNTGLATLMGCNALGISQTKGHIIVLVCCLANFYLSTWEEYHTGILFLSECSGPMEGLIAMCGVFIVTAVYGVPIWSHPLKDVIPTIIQPYLSTSILKCPLNMAFIMTGISLVLFNVFLSTYNVLTTPHYFKKSVLSRHSIISTILPFPLLMATMLLWSTLQPNITTHHMLPTSLTLTFLCGHQVGVIIVAHITHRPFPFLQTIIPSNVLLVGGILGSLIGGDAGLIVWTIAFGAMAMYGVWAYGVIHGLCHVFEIYCLRIGKREKHSVGVGGESKGHLDASGGRKQMKDRSRSRARSQGRSPSTTSRRGRSASSIRKKGEETTSESPVVQRVTRQSARNK